MRPRSIRSLGQLRCDGPQEGTPEPCDGDDNDCDGVVDEESPGLMQACLTGAEGVCWLCQWSTQLRRGTTARRSRHVPEVCNNVDDDCDGSVEMNDAGGVGACATDQVGECARGRRRCINRNIGCRPTNDPVDEACDGLDNDCDGITDEDVLGANLPCETGALGACSAGTLGCGEGDDGRIDIVCRPSSEPGDDL